MQRSWLGTLAGLVTAAQATAQATVHGRVVADSSSQPIVGADVTVGILNRAARTGRGGRFVLDSLPAGVFGVRIRAVGYRPLDLTLEIRPRDTIEVDFGLLADLQRLPAIEVRAPAAAPRSGKMEEFERRRRAGFGSFLTRADLAQWASHPISTPLRRLGNFRLIPRKWMCGGGFALATGRGGDSPPNPCTLALQACYVAIYLDGVLVWSPGMGPPPDINQYAAHGLQGMEVYRGPGELPAELQITGTACGAVVFWTRTGEAEESRPAPPAEGPGPGWVDS